MPDFTHGFRLSDRTVGRENGPAQSTVRRRILPLAYLLDDAELRIGFER